MGKNHTILNVIRQWSNIVERAKKIKQNPKKRERVIRFGFCAILYGLLTVACACALLLFQFVGQGFFLTVFGVIVAVGAGVFGTLICLITALIQWFCQLSLNKRTFTWISLALMLICFIAAALIPVLFFA